jgi:hypothetical protein
MTSIFPKAFSFLLGLAAIYLYYRNLWCYSKVRTKREKLKLKLGEDNPKYLAFKGRFPLFRCNILFRILIFLTFAVAALKISGKEGFLFFIAATVLGNLLLFWWGFKRGKPKRFSQEKN